ncbi:hypothetical protein L917_06271, partial [Phytophthora nicotianae]
EKIPSFPGHHKKDVPPRLLAQSTLPNTKQRIVDATTPDSRAQLRAHIDRVLEDRRQRVQANRSDRYQSASRVLDKGKLSALRAERLAVARKGAITATMDVMGRTVLTRASKARLQSNEDDGDALREVMDQLDAEDEEGEPSDDDSDYAEGGNTARDTGSDTGRDNGSDSAASRSGGDTGPKTGSHIDNTGLHRSGDGGGNTGPASGHTGSGTEGDSGGSSGICGDNDMEACDDEDEESDGGDNVASSSGFESASDVSQKRHRKGKRKSPKTKPRKTARIASGKSPRGGTDDDDGAFLRPDEHLYFESQ